MWQTVDFRDSREVIEPIGSIIRLCIKVLVDINLVYGAGTNLPLGRARGVDNIFAFPSSFHVNVEGLACILIIGYIVIGH